MHHNEKARFLKIAYISFLIILGIAFTYSYLNHGVV